MAYITLFPIGSAMRANFMVYRDMDDPWLRDMRQRPTLTMFAIMPGLRKLTGDAEVDGPVKIRPADLYVTQNICSPASCWSATPLRRRARRPAPAPARSSPTSSGSATSTCRAGSPPTAWASTRSPRSTTIRSSAPATGIPSTRRSRCARCRSTKACRGGRAAGPLPRPARHRHAAPGRGAACRQRSSGAASDRRATAPPRSFPASARRARGETPLPARRDLLGFGDSSRVPG